MRVIIRLVFVLYILFGAMIFAQEVKKKDEPSTNKVEYQRAQSNLNETALKIQRESKVDPAKWTLGQDLNYVAVPQPAKEKK